MNGHFSAVGEKPGAGGYEHGVQVIDEDKEFKYDIPMLLLLLLPLRYRHFGLY